MAGTSPFRGGFAWRFAKRLPSQRELSVARLTEDKLFCLGVHCCGGRVYLPPFAAKVSVSCPSDTRRWDGARLAAFRSPPPPLRPPTYKLVSHQTLAGCGGSVSRRDHNSKNRKTRPCCMGANLRRKSQAYSQPLFGRRGLGQKGASLREAASPPASPLRNLFGGGGARGRGLFLQKSPLPRIFHLPLLVPVLDGVLG